MIGANGEGEREKASSLNVLAFSRFRCGVASNKHRVVAAPTTIAVRTAAGVRRAPRVRQQPYASVRGYLVLSLCDEGGRELSKLVGSSLSHGTTQPGACLGRVTRFEPRVEYMIPLMVRLQACLPFIRPTPPGKNGSGAWMRAALPACAVCGVYAWHARASISARDGSTAQGLAAGAAIARARKKIDRPSEEVLFTASARVLQELPGASAARVWRVWRDAPARLARPPCLAARPRLGWPAARFGRAHVLGACVPHAPSAATRNGVFQRRHLPVR